MTPEQEPVEAQTTPPAPAAKSRADIARELFGKEFYGEAEQAKPEEKEPEAQPDESEPKEPAEETPPTEGEEQAPQPEESGEEKRSEEDTGERQIETWSELLEHHQYDPEWGNTLKVAVKVDGRQAEVPLGDLVASYQKQEMADQYLKEARDAKHSTTQELAEKRTALEGQFRVAAELVKAAEATLERDVQAINPQLRDQDPAEWSARITEFQQRRAAIEKMKYDTVQGFSAAQQQQAAEVKQQIDQYKAQEYAKLVDALPAWRDEKVADVEKAKLTEYAFRAGFTQPELANLLDHRQVLMLRKAMLYDESRGQVQTAKKKVTTVPKIMKPGAPKSQDQLAGERLRALHAKMVKTGKQEDAEAYMLAKRGVSR